MAHPRKPLFVRVFAEKLFTSEGISDVESLIFFSGHVLRFSTGKLNVCRPVVNLKRDYMKINLWV